LVSNFSSALWWLVVESEHQQMLAIDMDDDASRRWPVDLDVIVGTAWPQRSTGRRVLKRITDWSLS